MFQACCKVFCFVNDALQNLKNSTTFKSGMRLKIFNLPRQRIILCLCLRYGFSFLFQPVDIKLTFCKYLEKKKTEGFTFCKKRLSPFWSARKPHVGWGWGRVRSYSKRDVVGIWPFEVLKGQKLETQTRNAISGSFHVMSHRNCPFLFLVHECALKYLYSNFEFEKKKKITKAWDTRNFQQAKNK